MNDREQHSFEAELSRLTPASPPAELMARLRAAPPTRPTPRPTQPSGAVPAGVAWGRLLRWLVPATAMAAVALVMWRLDVWHWQSHQAAGVAQAAPVVEVSDVQIDRELVASFDAVARLPDGEPVRFRCQQWVDAVVLRDKASDVVIEERVPRVEVVPVRFETY